MSKAKKLVIPPPVHVEDKPKIKEKQVQKLTKKEQNELQEMFDMSEMSIYFMKQKQKNTERANLLADHVYERQAFNNVFNKICLGSLHMKKTPEDVQEYFIQQKISKQEQKALQLRIKRQQILLQLQYLDMQTSSTKSVSSLNISGDMKMHILSKQEHESFIDKTLKQRQLRDKKHQTIVEKLERSRIQSEMRVKQMQQKRMIRKRQKRKKLIEKSLSKKKEEHEKILQEEIKTRQQYEKVKKKKFLHEEIQQKYESQVTIPMLEERKRKLKEIRDLSREYNFENLKNHQKDYLQKRNQSFSTKSKIEDTWNYKPPEKVEKLSHFLEEEKIEQRKKLEERKRAIQEKITRQDTYIEYLKQKFVPKIDEKKKNELEERIKKTTNKRKQHQSDIKLLGIGYLQEAKRLKKRTIDQQNQIQKSTTQENQHQKRPEYPDYLIQMKRKHENYDSLKKERLQRLLKTPNQSFSKIKALEIESSKLNQAFKRKEELYKVKLDPQMQSDALDLLLTNIKAKIGLVNAYKETKNPE